MSQQDNDDNWNTITKKEKKKVSRAQMAHKKANGEATRQMLEAYSKDTKIERPEQEDKDGFKKTMEQVRRKDQHKDKKDEPPEKDEMIKKIPFTKRQQLIQLRELKGLNRKEVANLVQQSHRVIDGMENGIGVYDHELFNKVIQKLKKVPDKKNY